MRRRVISIELPDDDGGASGGVGEGEHVEIILIVMSF